MRAQRSQGENTGHGRNGRQTYHRRTTAAPSPTDPLVQAGEANAVKAIHWVAVWDLHHEVLRDLRHEVSWLFAQTFGMFRVE